MSGVLDSARRRVQGRCVEKSLVIQGRQIGSAELEQVRGLVAAHPDWSRYRLSRGKGSTHILVHISCNCLLIAW